MYSVAASIQELDYFTRLNREFQSDVYWWHNFLKEWNGVSFLPPQGTHHFIIHTDVSGSWGCAGSVNGKWFQLQWSQEWIPKAIMAKELVPIVIPYSRKIWRFGGLYYNRQIKIRQNFLLAYIRMAISYRTAKFKSANILLTAIWGSTAKFNARQYFRLYGKLRCLGSIAVARVGPFQMR